MCDCACWGVNGGGGRGDGEGREGAYRPPIQCKPPHFGEQTEAPARQAAAGLKRGWDWHGIALPLLNFLSRLFSLYFLVMPYTTLFIARPKIQCHYPLVLVVLELNEAVLLEATVPSGHTCTVKPLECLLFEHIMTKRSSMSASPVHLDTVILIVSYNHMTLVVNCKPTRKIELPLCIALRPPLTHKPPV